MAVKLNEMEKKQTVLRQINKLLQKQIEHLKELNDDGILLPNEFIHKQNQISSIQTLIGRFIPLEKQQIVDAYERGDKYKFEIPAEQYYTETYQYPQRDRSGKE